MNWTGGNLQRHSRPSRSCTTTLQKQHVAEVHSNLSMETANVSPMEWSIFDTAKVGQAARLRAVDQAQSHCHDVGVAMTQNDPQPFESSASDHAETAQVIKQEVNNDDLYDATPSPTRHGKHRRRSSSRSPSLILPEIQAQQRMDKADRRKRLLMQSDWVGMNIQRPLRLRFGNEGHVKKIGRRRKLVGSSGARYDPALRRPISSPFMNKDPRFPRDTMLRRSQVRIMVDDQGTPARRSSGSTQQNISGPVRQPLEVTSPRLGIPEQHYHSSPPLRYTKHYSERSPYETFLDLPSSTAAQLGIGEPLTEERRDEDELRMWLNLAHCQTSESSHADANWQHDAISPGISTLEPRHKGPDTIQEAADFASVLGRIAEFNKLHTVSSSEAGNSSQDVHPDTNRPDVQGSKRPEAQVTENIVLPAAPQLLASPTLAHNRFASPSALPDRKWDLMKPNSHTRQDEEDAAWQKFVFTSDDDSPAPESRKADDTHTSDAASVRPSQESSVLVQASTGSFLDSPAGHDSASIYASRGSAEASSVKIPAKMTFTRPKPFAGQPRGTVSASRSMRPLHLGHSLAGGTVRGGGRRRRRDIYSLGSSEDAESIEDGWDS